ncbi:MAG: DUF6549 family protein, partial [Bacilli bacterium]
IALLITIFGVGIHNIILSKQKEKYKNETNRLGQSLKAELTGKKDFIFRDSINASKIEMLQLTNKELAELRKEDAKTIKDLKIRKKDVEVIGNTTTKIEIKEKLVFKDSCFSYNDSWNKVKFCLTNDSLDLQIKDSLGIVISNIPKKFLFFKFGSKGVEVNLIPYNPKAKISYAKFVKIKK